MPLHLALVPKSLVISVLVSHAAAQYNVGDDGQSNVGSRVIAGVLIGLAALTLLLTLAGMLRRRRRLRARSILPPPGGVATEDYFQRGQLSVLPMRSSRSQTHAEWSTTDENQLPAYTPPPPPYHKKDSSEEETIERIPEETLPQFSEFEPPPGSPAPAHVHDINDRFGWLRSSQ
ncbi:hypothetical protein B0H21DRAFT_818615 [Amylocystis lapponica]|nr:hypothetical protein B0H21DRAFT_818615 [Amylocystis lapponica]